MFFRSFLYIKEKSKNVCFYNNYGIRAFIIYFYCMLIGVSMRINICIELMMFERNH